MYKFIDALTFGFLSDYKRMITAETDEEIYNNQINITINITAALALSSCIIVLIISHYYTIYSILIKTHTFVTVVFFLSLITLRRTNLSFNMKLHLISIMISVEYIFIFFMLYPIIKTLFWFTLLLVMVPAASSTNKLLKRYMIGLTTFFFISSYIFFRIKTLNQHTILLYIEFIVFFLIVLTVIFASSSFKTIVRMRDKKNNLLYDIAYKDELTGLPNRKLIINSITELIEQQVPFYFIYLDLDDFKCINDSLSHQIGDELLIKISHLLKNLSHADDIIARMGGDEFAIIVKQNISQDDLSTYVINLLGPIKSEFCIENTLVNVNCSCGISNFPKDSNDVHDLLKAADTALYEAKAIGKNAICNYKPIYSDRLIEKVKLENALAKALPQNEFHLVFQPIIGQKNKTLGFEALIRWRSQELGPIYPDKFIRNAEECGVIHQIGLWVMEEAFITLNDIYSQGDAFPTMSINISPIQLMRQNFASEVNRLIEKHNINANHIIFEFTESIFIDNQLTVNKNIQAIKKLNIKTAIDDFGTGYSSLSYLPSLPVDYIKIDKSFIDKISHSSAFAKLVKSIITMGHDLNKLVTAEGVEDKYQRDYLRANNCDFIQGTFYSKPLNKEHLFGYLKNFQPLD